MHYALAAASQRRQAVPMQQLIDRIAARQTTVGVVGLGHVGVTVAAALADAGFRVLGVDANAERVRQIGAGEYPFAGIEPELPALLARGVRSRRLSASTSFGPLAEADIVLIDVDTPVGGDHLPSFASLQAACEDLAGVLKARTLVVIESTVAPGTCASLVVPALERDGAKKLNRDFFLGHCPERVMPGRMLENLRELPRTCGGATPETSRAMEALYRSIGRGRLDPCDCVTAELVKTAENAYRDVNIAFANELGAICETVGADFRRVRELVNHSPGRDLLLAGAGVGGHCIPKDPWLLMHAADGGAGARPRLMRAAREVNEAMPLRVTELALDALAELGVPLRGAKIAVFGYAYLENTGDTRNSPSRVVAEYLVQRGATVAVHDPWVPAHAGDPYDAARGANAVLLMVAHAAYRGLDLERLRKVVATPVLVDGRFLVEEEAAHDAGFTFRAIGRGRSEPRVLRGALPGPRVARPARGAASRVPFVDLTRLLSRVRDDVLQDWNESLRSGELVGGSRVRALEEALARALGAPHVVACANGTDAVLVALQAAGVRRGMKVALPNLTFWATFEAVAQLGAIPVLVDIDPDDLQMSLAELRSAHDAHRLDAAVLVHLYGWASSRLREIRAFCQARAIALIEDGAQSFGVEASGEPLLAQAAVATLSFYPTKVVGGAMDGGALALQSQEQASLVRALSNHGRSGHYQHEHVGWNCRMGEVQAAFVARVLGQLPSILQSRRAAAAWYRKRLEHERRIKVHGPPEGIVENGYMNVITVEGRDAEAIVAALAADGIQAARTYPRTLADQPPARDAGAIAHGDLRWSRGFCRRVLNLPLFFAIREDECEAAARTLLGAL